MCRSPQRRGSRGAGSLHAKRVNVVGKRDGFTVKIGMNTSNFHGKLTSSVLKNTGRAVSWDSLLV